ncbi:hypothetical protein [Evtepia sp.]|uniref:hypothetical protein n=1 Tax=Evtepia sp. TaxID=2773933 RepID=UPI002E786805|nr:hypothetical protein [Evtepia sp.]MEE0256879.1 hypothetical protein [Evtepia sp.]
MIKKIGACILSLAVMVSTLTVAVGAVSPASEASQDGLIPENVAYIMATYFVRDAQTMEDSKWNDDTEISDTVTMYDVDGQVSAYSFELETNGKDAGYIVVSAYRDVESKILEFSDTAEPVYEALDLVKEDTVVYTGGLNYFKKVDAGRLISVDGNVVKSEEVSTPLQDSRDAMYRAQPQQPLVTTSEIDDPAAWAKSEYGGTFTATEWKNAFENYCKFRTMDTFSQVNGVNYSNHCGPTAITNLLEIVARYRGYSGVPYNNITQVFSQVAQFGISKGYFINDVYTGFDTSTAYVKECFSLYSINTSVTNKTINYNNVKTAINGYNPLFIALQSHGIYGSHFVTGYAYTCFTNESGQTASFIKIADGWNSSGRYLPLSASNPNSSIITGLRSMDVVSILSLG